jgi:hypothetical protein
MYDLIYSARVDVGWNSFLKIRNVYSTAINVLHELSLLCLINQVRKNKHQHDPVLLLRNTLFILKSRLR